MSKMLKNVISRDLERQFESLDGFIVVNPEGLDSAETFDFRKNMREAGASVTIVPNRLAKRVLKEKLELNGDERTNEAFDAFFRGQTALIIGEQSGSDGVITSAKAVSNWLKKHKNRLSWKGGVLDGEVLSEEAVQGLSEIPDLQTLYSQLAGLIQEPLRTLAVATDQILTSIAYALKAIEEKKEKEG